MVKETAIMAEQLDLGAPAQSAPGTVTWKPILVHKNFEQATIKVGFRGDNGEYTSISWDGAVATALMIVLNKANLGAKSENKRLMEKAIVDGKLAGTISGVPD